MILKRLGLPIVLGGTVWAATAHSEPLSAHGPIFAGDQEVGRVADAPITIARWLSPKKASFTVAVTGDDGGAARVHGILHLDNPKTWLKAHVCQETRLSKSGMDSFELWMLPDTEAVVVSRAPRGPLIRVRPPVVNDLDEEHLLPIAALGGDCRLPPTRSKYLVCEPFMLHGLPDPNARSYTIDSARAVRATARKEGWYRVEVDDFEGFRWHGFAQQAPKCSVPPPAGPATGVPGVSVHVPGPQCWDARIPRGAVLRAAKGGVRLLEVTREFQARLCDAGPFEWEVELSIGWGSLSLNGIFDGSPRALPDVKRP